MSKKTSRIKAIGLASREEFTATVNRIADLQAQANVITTRRDAILQRIKAKFDERLKPLVGELKAKVQLASAYGIAHRTDLLPKDRKSVDLAQATYGFRTGNRTVEFLDETFDEAKVIELLKAKSLEEYVEEVEVMLRAKILADCEDDLHLHTLAFGDGDAITIPAEKIPLADVGLKIVQKETFYIAPKVETGTTVKTEEAAA